MRPDETLTGLQVAETMPPLHRLQDCGIPFQRSSQSLHTAVDLQSRHGEIVTVSINTGHQTSGERNAYDTYIMSEAGACGHRIAYDTYLLMQAPAVIGVRTTHTLCQVFQTLMQAPVHGPAVTLPHLPGLQPALPRQRHDGLQGGAVHAKGTRVRMWESGQLGGRFETVQL